MDHLSSASTTGAYNGHLAISSEASEQTNGVLRSRPATSVENGNGNGNGKATLKPEVSRADSDVSKASRFVPCQFAEEHR